MIISVTERQTFKRCRRRWDYSSFNRQSLTPIINAPALEVGTLVHSTLAKWTIDTKLDPVNTYDLLALEALNHIMDQYKQSIGCSPSADELQPMMEAMAMGHNMIANYAAYWKTPLPPGYSLVENEQTVLVDIPNTGHMECQCQTGCEDCNSCINCSTYVNHKLEATFDGIMSDASGQWFIIERKTYSRRPSTDELDENDQFIAYMWVLSQIVLDKVRGVAYDGLWKREKPPTGKTLQDLFLRKLLMRNIHEIQEFGQLLAQEAIDMAVTNVPIYKHVPPLGGCWDCSTFRPLCKSQSRGELYATTLKQYIKRDRADWRGDSSRQTDTQEQVMP